MNKLAIVLPLLGIIGATLPAHGQEKLGVAERLKRQAESGLGGPQSVSAELEQARLASEDVSRRPELDRALDGVLELKKEIRERSGLDLGLRYSMTYQRASDSLTDEQDGAAGQIRLFGKWRLKEDDKNNVGSFVFVLEDRHRIGDGVAPTDLAGEIGSLGPTSVSYGANGDALTIAYYEQVFADGNAGYWLGRIDPTDLTDILGYANQRTTFANASILTNLVLPGPAPGFGFALAGMLGDKVYTVGTIADANGDYSNIEWFPGGRDELYKYVEFAFVPSRQERYLRNVHIGFFHIDDRDGAEESYGTVVSGNWLVGDDKWLPFFRVGSADGDGAGVERSYALGTLYKPDIFNDLVGFGVGRVEPAVPESRDQTTYEVFYRYSFSRDIAVTATLQSIQDPTNNPEEDQISVFGIRARAAF